jgi:hypothetical protein
VQVTGGAQVKVYYSINGTLAINVFGARVTGSPSFGQALANTIGASIKSGSWPAIAAQMAPTTSLVRVGIRDLRQDNLPEFRDSGAAVAGTGTGDALPAGVGVVVTLRTAMSGKSYRGRTYVSGLTEAANGPQGTILTAASTAAVNFVGSIASVMNTNGLTHAVLSTPSDEVIVTETTNHANGTTTTRTLSHEKARNGGVTDVTGYETRQALWGHQRRRDNGRGVAPAIFGPIYALDLNEPAPPPPARSK